MRAAPFLGGLLQIPAPPEVLLLGKAADGALPPTPLALSRRAQGPTPAGLPARGVVQRGEPQLRSRIRAARGARPPLALASLRGSGLLVLALPALLACQREPTLELLEVNRVSATEVQFGDALQVSGDGFALGKSVLVRFRGQVYRAGLPPRSVDIALGARAESQHDLSVPLPREAEVLFCGAEAGAAHATFRGDLQVAIAASEPGAPPVTGTLHGSTLELYPALEVRAVTEQRTLLGRRALEFFGLELSSARAGGLGVSQVLAGSRASDADLQPGDRIVRAGGLSVLEPSDLVPAPGRSFEVGVLRRGLPRSLLLDADGFAGAPPLSTSLAALLLGVAALGFVLWTSPLRRLLAALLPPWLEQLRAQYAAGARRGPSSLLAALPPSAVPRAASQLGGPPDALVFLGTGAALLAPALRRTPIDVGLGLLALAFGSATLLLAASLVEGGRAGSVWSLRRGVRAALQQSLVLLPVWIGLLAIGLESGVDADEWQRSQGALPWTWNAFANPGLSLLFLCMLLTALPQPCRAAGRLRHARVAAGSPRRGSLLGSLYACSLCALGALAFLGGGAGLADAGAGAVGLSRLAPSLLCWLKYACLCGGLSWLRGLTQRLTLEQWAPFGITLVLPSSLAAVVLAQSWRALAARSEFWHWVCSGFGPIVVAALVLSLPLSALAVRSALRKSDPFPGLSPWL
jgi:NADH-quinone oxidoreductase subunit H